MQDFSSHDRIINLVRLSAEASAPLTHPCSFQSHDFPRRGRTGRSHQCTSVRGRRPTQRTERHAAPSGHRSAPRLDMSPASLENRSADNSIRDIAEQAIPSHSATGATPSNVDGDGHRAPSVAASVHIAAQLSALASLERCKPCQAMQGRKGPKEPTRSYAGRVVPMR